MSIGLARRLRREPTIAEHKLWRALRAKRFAGIKFRGQHTDRAQQDEQRTVALATLGGRVIRLWNNEVLQNLEGVLVVIEAAVRGTDTSPP